MANVQKVYRIEIQLDNARQQLADTSTKLAALDKQLEGLDRNSDEAKAIVAQMAALAAQAEAAEGKVGSLSGQLNQMKPGTIGALRQEFVDLAAELNTVAEGSAEANRILVRMGEVKGEIKGLKDEVKALDPEKRIGAFNNFAQGVVGAFGVATVAAETFGLSSTTAEEFTKKTQGVIAVLGSLEAIRNSLDDETLKSIKSTLKLADAYIFSGTAAEGASKTTKAALLATGIGIVLVLVGLLAANFDKVKEVGASIATKFKPVFDAVGGFIDTLIAKARDLGSVLTFGLIDNAAKHAQQVSEDFRRTELAKIVEHTARLIEIQKARGVDTLALEVENAKRRLDSLKQSTEEEKKVFADARKDYLVLAAQYEKRQADETRAARLAHLSALAAAETARGASTFASQLAAKREQIAQLNEAEQEGAHVSQAQRIQLDSELSALLLAHDKELADKRAALQGATLQAQLVRLQASTSEQSLVEVEANTKQIEIAQQHRATLLAQAQVDSAAVVAADAELYKLRLDRSRIFYRQEAEQAQALRDEYDNAIAALRAKDLANEQQYQANLNRAQAAGARVTKQVADALSAELALTKMKADADADIGGNLLIRLFGLTDAQAQSLKGRLVEVATQVSGLVSAMMAGATAEADAALTEAQTRLSELSAQLSAASQQRQSDEQALQSATGARREYLLGKIQKEAAAEQKLAGEKAKAAREEQAAQKEKAKLDKIQQEITAASSAVEATLLGIKAAKAVVDAADKGKIGYDNIALAIAAAAAIGISIVSMKNIAKSMGDGGIIEGGSHASGNDVPVMGGKYRVEGGEAITPVDATVNNGPALELIRTKGRNKKLTAADFAELSGTQVRPAPTGGSYGAGGILGSRGSVAGPGQVVVREADLSALVANTSGMLAHLQTVAATNQQIAGYGPAKLNIGPFEATQIEQQKQQAAQAEQHATL
jgi:hypothetical protein